MMAVANTPPLRTRHQFILLIEKTFPLRHSGLTSELTRRRESKHPSPHQASCETRYRRSRPTICWRPGVITLAIDQLRAESAGRLLLHFVLSFDFHQPSIM